MLPPAERIDSAKAREARKAVSLVQIEPLGRTRCRFSGNRGRRRAVCNRAATPTEQERQGPVWERRIPATSFQSAGGCQAIERPVGQQRASVGSILQWPVGHQNGPGTVQAAACDELRRNVTEAPACAIHALVTADGGGVCWRSIPAGCATSAWVRACHSIRAIVASGFRPRGGLRSIPRIVLGHIAEWDFHRLESQFEGVPGHSRTNRRPFSAG